MTPEGRDRGFVEVGSVEEPTDTLTSVEGTAHQHQSDNASNLDMRVHHHDLSQHPHHPLDNSGDPTNSLFSHQQHLQPHRHDLNGMPSSTDTNHMSGSELLQQHLLTHNSLTALHHQPPLHHPEQHHHQYQPQQQLQQQEHHLHNLNHQPQQHPFSYHHERHSSGDDENDSIVEATTALQHDVVDVGGLHQHAHPTDIAPMTDHHHQNHRIISQEHEHQIPLGMVYHPHPYAQQYQQDTQQLQQQPQHANREQEDPTSSVDPTQASVGMASSMFPPQQNSPLTLPPRTYPQMSKKPDTPSAKGKKATRGNKKGGIATSKLTDKKRKLKQTGSIVNDGSSIERGPLASVKKPRRRRYDNNFKAEVLKHLKGPHTKLSDVARRYGIPENTLREWTKANVVRAIETARSKNSGQLKANMYDPMKRLTETLNVFFEHNMSQPEHVRQSITTKLIVAKGLEARNTLLERHATHPFLEPREKKALENFSGSDSWAKKFAKRRALKMTGARIKELSEEEVNEFHRSLKQISNRIKQAGPGYEESANLIRQAAEKLLLASIIHSTASHRIMGNIAISSCRNDRKKHRSPGSTSQLQQAHRQQQMDDPTSSKLQPDELVQTHILRDALNITSPTPDQHPPSP